MYTMGVDRLLVLSMPSANVAGSSRMVIESIKVNTLRVHRLRRRKQNRRVSIPGSAAGFEKKGIKAVAFCRGKLSANLLHLSKTRFSFDMFGLLATLALAATAVVQGV